jgi:hypothetical protein
MSKIPILTAIRIIPRDANFLDRKSGQRGEIFFDQVENTLRLYDGVTSGGTNLAKSDLSNVSNDEFLAKASSVGIGNTDNAVFELTIAGDDSTVRTISSGNVIKFTGSGSVSTEINEDGEITIDSPLAFSEINVAENDTITGNVLTLVAGTNISITTDSETATVTFSASEGGVSGNNFSTISVAGQSNIVAESTADILNIVAGTGISITTDAASDTLVFNNTVAGGATAFTGLNDSGGLTVDRFYLPAITMLTVTNNGASAYRFDQYGTTNNPTVYAINGTTIAFNLTATGHPFLIQTPSGVNYNTGLTHVSTAGVVSTGSAAQGKDSGTLYWKIPTDISGGYRYQCSVHVTMVGSISIKTFSTL